MSEDQLFPVPKSWAARAHIDAAGYEAAWEKVERDPEGYWRSVAERLDWMAPFTAVKDVSFAPRRFPHPLVRRRRAERLGQLPRPASAAAGERHRHHLGGRRSGGSRARSPMPRRMPRSAAWPMCCGPRRSKGDRVTIYLPMIPEAAYAMLACARIGAVHSVVFGGFSPESLAGRIQRLRLQGGDHRRRGRARRQDRAAEAQRGRGAEPVPAR